LRPRISVVVGIGQEAGGTGKLRLKYPARRWSAAEVITKSDGIKRVHGFNRTSYGFPKGIGRRRAVVEADAKLSKIGGKKCDTALIYSAVFEGRDVGIEINANRRLAG
jgi:hypothetical protein